MMIIPVASSRRQLDARELSRPCVTSFFYLLRRSFLEAKVISKIQKYQTTYLLHVAFLYLMFIGDVVIVHEGLYV